MLNRQKVLLALLGTADRPVSKIELMKWCFLLRHEATTSGGSAFYEFLPYHFGPYSFTLTRELDDLVATGYVREDGERLLRTELPARGGRLPARVETDAAQLIRRFGSFSVEALLDHVYGRHPQFTMNSRRQRLTERPVGEEMVYTVGYEGRQVDDFLWVLISAGVGRLIDVRNNPIARRYGFHKSTLTRLCTAVGIEYVHVPELGIKSADRRGIDTQTDRDHLFTSYTSATIPSQEEAVRRVVGWMTERPSALMCMEAAPCECHRSHLADEVARRTGLPIRHLGVEHGRGTTD